MEAHESKLTDSEAQQISDKGLKLLIASDIHGSAFWCERLIEAIEAEDPDQILLLGDFLYHGPRNDLPQDYAPKRVIAMLNSLAQRRPLLACRGNCDAEVDQMVLDFPIMADYFQVMVEGRQLFCTHGHLFDPSRPESLPKLMAGSAFLSGHTHIKVYEEREGIYFFNPGSVSIPKDGSHSYGIYQNGNFMQRILENNQGGR